MHIIFYEKLDNDNYENIDRKKNAIALINKNETNIIITTLIKKIKRFLKTKYKFNLKIKEIINFFIKIKKLILRENTFKIIDNARLFLIFKK